jgi:putative ABC transport system permease protein
MKKSAAWHRYLRFWRNNVAADVDDELRFHTEMRVTEYMARGMTADQARRAVMTRLGDVDAARAECIELGHVREQQVRRADFVDGLRADLSFALRSLGGSPGWTAVALMTIALGVGATSAVFNVADTLLVRPFSYPDASRVFIVRRQFEIGGTTANAPIQFAAVGEWRTHARTIEAAMPFGFGEGRLGTGRDAITVHGTMIDTGFLAFAGERPLIGRNFTAAEITPNGPDALLLSEPFWRRQYGASTDVIGKTVLIDDRSSTIVGVVPASLSIPDFRSEPADIYVPLRDAPNMFVSGVLVRLKRDVSAQASTEELDGIFKRAGLVTPMFLPKAKPMTLRLTNPRDGLRIRQPVVMLSIAVALLLCVACTNVAHLLLARGAARQRELAVRHALGAGRVRLLRQLVTESVLLAAIGGMLAAGVGWAGLKLLVAARPADLVELAHISGNRGILSISSVLAVACGLTIGLLAALRSAHRDLGTTLRAGTSRAPLTGRLRASLVVGEVALSATLLVGALLLIHAVFDLQRTRLGFDARGLYGVTFALEEQKSPAERGAFASMVRGRTARIPGVEGVTLAGNTPSPHYFRMLSALETPERPATGEVPTATGIFVVAADYFSMLRMPLLAGRTFDEGSLTRNEVIVSTALARQLWPNENPIGRRVRNSIPRPGQPLEPWQTVIAVVPDVVTDLVEGALHPAIYRPLITESFSGNALAVIVRSRGENAMTSLRTLAEAVQPNNLDIVIANVRELIDESLAQPRFTMRVLVIFAALGVLLAAIGLYGVISYSVGQRTREIGVRMTLGATRNSIARLVVGDGIRLAILGIAIGILGAVAATRLIQKLLYGVSPLDPFAFGMGAALLLAVSVAACVIPMLRATGVDPVIAVRVE